MSEKKQLGALLVLESTIPNQMRIDINKLSLFTGMNGTGKTLILRQIWILNYIVNTYVYTEGKISLEQITKALQFLFDNSFDNNDFTGRIKGEFAHLEIEFVIDNGTVSNLSFMCIGCDIKDLEPMGLPNYMSSDMRLFSDIIKYLKFKKLLKLDKPFTEFTDEELKSLCEVYKIFDVISTEKLLSTLENSTFTTSEQVKKTLFELTKKDITFIFYDKKNSDIIVTEKFPDGTSKDYSILKLGAGEQALINMFIQSM